MKVRQRVGRRGSPVRRRFRQPWRWLPFGVRLRVASVRAWSVRHKSLRRLGWLAVLLITTGVLVSSVAGARATRAQWGDTVDAFVMVVDLAVGDELTERHVVSREWPVALLPADTLHDLPHADVVAGQLRVGDIITSRDLRSTREALQLPDGHRAVSLPRDPTIPGLVVGDLIDLHVVAVDAWAELETRGVHGGHVVDVTDDAYVVALAQEHVAAVVSAVASGRVVIALR